MNNTKQLHDLGQSLWLDKITREILDNGTLGDVLLPHSRLPPGDAGSEIRAKRDRLVVIRISGTVDERDPALAGSLHEVRYRVLLLLELAEVALLELPPACRVVAEPLSQPGRGSDLLSPFIELQVLLGAATRPYSVDEDAVPVAPLGRVVGASDLDAQRRCLLEPAERWP
jgi:hypothetical protein